MLAVVLLGTFVHYGADGPRRSYPSPGSIDANYDSHVGEEAFLLATVTEVSETGVVTLRVRGTGSPYELSARGVDASVSSGALVQIHGDLGPDREVSVRNVVVVNETQSAELYKYAISVVGALLVLVFFFRYWTVDTNSLAFEVRRDG